MPDSMDEGRKRVLLIAASILAARHLDAETMAGLAGLSTDLRHLRLDPVG